MVCESCSTLAGSTPGVEGAHRFPPEEKVTKRGAMLTLVTPTPPGLVPFPPTPSACPQKYFCQNTPEYMHSALLPITNSGFKNKKYSILLQELKLFQWGSLIFVFILPYTLLSCLQRNKEKLILNRLPSSHVFNRKCVLLKAKETWGARVGAD